MINKILIVAFTYVGTIIGAGFASGQEIKNFFVNYGVLGIISFFLAAFLFYYIGKKIMLMGHKSRAESYDKILMYAFTCKARKLFDYAIVFFLICTATIMSSGMGAILNQSFGIPKFIGNVGILVIASIFVFLGFAKIMKLSLCVIPMLILSTLLISSSSFSNVDNISFVSEQMFNNSLFCIFSALLYVSYNIMLSISILPVLGSSLKSEKEIDKSAKIASIIIGIVGIIICVAIFLNYSSLSNAEVPLLAIASKGSVVLSILYFISFTIAVLTTLVSALYGLYVRANKNIKYFIVAIIVAFVLSLFGFSTLVKTMYTFMGYVGIFIILMLIRGFSKSKIK